METIYEEARQLVEKEELRLAAQNLQHLLKIQKEQASLENIVASLEKTLIDTEEHNPEDFCRMMATQARILDATFHYFVDQSKESFSPSEKLCFALKAQAQTVRTALAWRRLKEQAELLKKIHTERTEQNAPLDS